LRSCFCQFSEPILAAAFNVSLSKQTPNQASKLVLANVEALASEGDDYPTFVKDAIPAKETLRWYGTTGTSGYVTLRGVTFGPFGVKVHVEFSCQSGICPPQKDAVCKYSHIGEISMF